MCKQLLNYEYQNRPSTNSLIGIEIMRKTRDLMIREEVQSEFKIKEQKFQEELMMKKELFEK